MIHSITLRRCWSVRRNGEEGNKWQGQSYQKAVTEAKSLVETMTPSAATANANWNKRRARPPGVPGMPWMSFILTLGGFSAASVRGGASTGCTAGRLTNISLTPTPRSWAAKLARKPQRRIPITAIIHHLLFRIERLEVSRIKISGRTPKRDLIPVRRTRLGEKTPIHQKFEPDRSIPSWGGGWGRRGRRIRKAIERRRRRVRRRQDEEKKSNAK